jgi:dipeptidyl aminopeptidase/acylaminoacyl peptidase
MRAVFAVLWITSTVLFTACSSTPGGEFRTSTEDLKSLPAEVQAFVLQEEFDSARLSPTGKYLAVSYIRNGHATLAIMERATIKITAAVDLDQDFIIKHVMWAGPNRVVVDAVNAPGMLMDNVHYYQRIYAMDADGKNKRRIYPEGCGIGRECIVLTGSFSRIMSEDIFEGRYLIVQESKYGANLNQREILRKIDVFTGDHTILDHANLVEGDYEIDNAGSARVMKSMDESRKVTLYARDLKNNSWNQIKWASGDGEGFYGLRFSKDNRNFYFLNPNEEGFLTLYRAEFDEQGLFKKIQVEFSPKGSDIFNVVFDKNDKVPLYADYGWGLPKRKYLSATPVTRTLAELDKAFPGEKVDLIDHRGDEMLLSISSDTHPGAFYIYDLKAQAVRKLLSANPKVDPKKVVPSRHVVIKARDGVLLHAYLYVPSGAKGPRPLLINIHGGPFGVAERWGYSAWDQLFVSQGYAVMRVNFRGSGGAGVKFERLGYKNLGTTMQADIADTAQWAIDKGFAQKGKVCTMGGSYGGYSAVMSAILYPDLFKCALGWGGVYDWNTLTSQNDAQLFNRSLKYWEQRLPNTFEERARQSPVTRAAELKANLFIVHGINDRRVPIQQARALKGALESAGKPFRYYEYDDVGHWFKDQARKDDFYARSLEFFKEQLPQ